ncbi:hypothetical protein ES703_28589 [subsurface metagenome]
MQKREYLVQKITFNTHGKKIKEVRYSTGSKSQEIDYIYNRAGRLREIRDVGDDWKRIQRFDESGKKTEEIKSHKYSDQVWESWKQLTTANGTTIEYKSYNNDGKLNRNEITSFDRAGRVTEKRYEPKYGDHRRWEYKYDDAGNLRQGKFYEKNYDRPDVWSSSYDGRGNLIEVRHVQDEDWLHSKRSYFYDDRDGMIRQVVQGYSKSGDLEYTWTYIYDSRGNVIEEVYRHQGKTFQIKWSYAYDRNNERTGEIFYNSQDSVFSGYRTTNEYDSQNRLIETIRYDLSGTQQSRTRYTYNYYEELTENIVYNPDNSLNHKTTYEYEYDQRRNWIVMRTFYTNNVEERYKTPTLIQFRTIKYYY